MSTDRVICGPLSRVALEGYDLLIRSPGISPYRQSLQHAKSAGVEITTPSNLWFAAHPQEKTICVTGTKGKSTTSTLIAHALQSCGHRVRLAGNIGLPLLSCEDRNVDWWVIELSSYQLTDLMAAPTVAVILNLTAEHLDWHGGEQAYRRDKLRLAELAAKRIAGGQCRRPFAERGSLQVFEYFLVQFRIGHSCRSRLDLRWASNAAG